MKKLAIIGASYLQEPLIKKAKNLGIETHVFAWKCGDVGEIIADYFYPISIIEKEKILEKCMEIQIDGICTIASDLATLTVCYVAESMRLAGNSIATSIVSTNKHEMRKCFEKNGDPSPKSILVESVSDLEGVNLEYPLIVKPLDRSGSRGITKVTDYSEIAMAIENAKEEGFEKRALVEEFVEGKEYSVEYISWNGKHYFLALTEKFTTGAPGFIETGHIQPAVIDETVLGDIKRIVPKALNSLGVTLGASHTEIKVDATNKIKIIEIGARMGGDFIGSHLVKLSTGYDFVEGVIRCALGEFQSIKISNKDKVAAVKFAMNHDDCLSIKDFVNTNNNVVSFQIEENENSANIVTDSSNRKGYCLALFENQLQARDFMDL